MTEKTKTESELAGKLKTAKAAGEAGASVALTRPDASVLGWLNATTTKNEIARALPRGLDEARFARVVQTEVRRNPALLESDPQSFILAVLTTASLGLEPGPLGHAYITGPFKNRQTGRKETVLILGYKGLCELAYRSGQVDLVDAVAVHEGEPFRIVRGSENRLEHEELVDKQDGPVVAYYAIAHPRGDGRPVFDVMTPAEIAKVRERSRAKDSGPWQTDYEAMALKTVTRRLLNRGKVRLTPEVQEAIALDEARELGHDRPEVLAEVAFAPAPLVNADGEAVDTRGHGEQGQQPDATPAEKTPEPEKPVETPAEKPVEKIVEIAEPSLI